METGDKEVLINEIRKWIGYDEEIKHVTEKNKTNKTGKKRNNQYFSQYNEK